ncbi:hypothetical protein [Pleomorphomonas sp. PLEO]|uniref:hypothetical protein n=1 Tax=Pleomorphomonas sp. PLEO TaxID=3239306 RepID=UPI00351EEBA2
MAFQDGRSWIVSAAVAAALLSTQAAQAEKITPNGAFDMPIECQSPDDVAKVVKGEAGKFAFEIQDSTSCKFVTDVTDSLIFKVESCTGPAASVLFLTSTMEFSRHAFVMSVRVIPFLEDEVLKAACRKEYLDWVKTNRKQQ